MSYIYSTEKFTADILVEDYMTGFKDAERFIELCKQCPNYGNSWGCPPFDFDTEKFLQQYRYARLMATKIIPEERNISFNKSRELIYTERQRIEAELLGMEKQYGGHAFAYVGSCLYCNGVECRRKYCMPCLHPEKVRPSLEAFGFDIGRTMSELFGIKLLWGKDGILPEYLVLVSGFFHNTADIFCPRKKGAVAKFRGKATQRL